MFKLNKFAGLVLTAVLGTVALITPPSTHARNTYDSPWETQYPTSQSYSNAGCMLCHTTTNGKGGLNPYGTDLDIVLPANPSNTELTNALIAIQGNDSDNDPTGSSNLVEINASTQPGWAAGDNPLGVSGDLDPVADISVSPLSIDFGAVSVAASATESVTISNDGSAELAIDSLTLSGTSEFMLSGSPTTPFTIAAGNSVNLTVEYVPVDDGLDNGTLEIASDSPGETLISVALSGTGVPVQVNECVPVVDPASLQFGSVELGNTLALTAAVTNNGTLECAVNAAVSSTSGEFSLVSAVMFMVAPGASVNVDVNYTPADLGDDAGQLALTFPDRSINVPLSGTGIEVPAADISVSPPSVDFGGVTVAASATESVTISNVGSAELTVNSLTLSGTSEFSLSGPPATPFTIAAGNSVNLTVEYVPVDDGLDNGTLEIASDSPGETLISVALSGTGVPVQVNACVPVVDPASLQFGSVELGNTLALTTAVTNNGTLECAVNAAVTSTSGEFSLVSAVMFTVSPGASVNVEVNYAPANPGDDAGQLTLTFPNSNINVPLSGTGIELPADISVNPLSVDFGAVTVATSTTESVTISNDGSAELTVNSLSLLGISEFSLSGPPATPFTVAAGNSVNLTVEYGPVDDGLDNGTLEIASDSPGEALISVALSGTGVPVQVNACVPVVDPASLQFGSVELGNTLALTTAVTNNGTLECAVNAAVTSTSGEFSLVSAVMFTVSPGASVNVEVNYAPADPGDDAGQLSLTFPDRSISVPLSGTGIESGGGGSGDSGSSSLSLFDLGLLVLFCLLGLARRKLP